jgi:hypothetical protein
LSESASHKFPSSTTTTAGPHKSPAAATNAPVIVQPRLRPVKAEYAWGLFPDAFQAPAKLTWF